MTDNEFSKCLQPGEPVVDIWSTVIRSVSDIGGVRFEASAALQLVGLPQRLVDDVALIITELAVNALEHGRAGFVEVLVGARAGNTVEVRVAHDEDLARFDVAEPPTMAPDDEFAGRGRAIVAALSQRFETTTRPPRRVEHLVVLSA